MASTDAQPARSRNIVVVQNKLPWGLDIFLDQDGIDEQSGKGIKVPRPETRVRLNGANSSNVIGGYGLTEVDADYWAAWLKSHGNYAPIKSGVIKAQPTRERAMAQAMDEKELKTKLEPIDPDKPGDGLTRVPEKELRAAAEMGAI